MVSTLKFTIIGNSTVGKSSIMERLTHDQFNFDTEATIGASYGVKHFELGERRYRVEMWDTAGQERFRSLLPMYYRCVNGVILVCDVTNRDSMSQLQYWLEEANKHCYDVPVIIMANKIDLVSSRRVTLEDLNDFVFQINNKNIIGVYETSALLPLEEGGINEAVISLIKGAKPHFDKHFDVEGLTLEEPAKRKCCW